MKADTLREKFLKFFEDKQHQIIPSAPLIPENDPTVLFTMAGMHPLAPYLLGEKHPLGQRLCNVQRCIRTGDINDVGDATHLTFFEMLGNWSLGDYFKKEAIEWSFEFLTKECAISLDRLAFTVFEGEPENRIPRDEEAAALWRGLGVPNERVAFLGRADNWWGPAGNTGPCGPCTEMFYWTGSEAAPQTYDPNDKRWVEIWNDVFMQYNKKELGRFEILAQKNVDTGMGLERMTALMQGQDNVYETELFAPMIDRLAELSQKQYFDHAKFFRIIVDHIKAAVFIMGDGLSPSNTERGYVLRRLLRRAIRYGRLLGLEKPFTGDLAQTVFDIYSVPYPELLKMSDKILTELNCEEERFNRTLAAGLKEFNKIAESKPLSITGRQAFDLYQSFGFPLEMTMELAREVNLTVDEQGFQQELQNHQELSRTASAGQFKSGLADHSEKTTRYHTATHLLHQALREVLGEKVEQRGSNINSERLRFDFAFERKLTPEEIQRVGDLVNQKIEEQLEISCSEMAPDEAKARGAIGLFGHKYGSAVKVYAVGGKNVIFSQEICSGPHVSNTKELGCFKIIKEEASSQGVRRIKAILS